MHLLRQDLFSLLRHGLLRSLGHYAVASGMAHTSVTGRIGADASIVDTVRNFLFDFLRENFLELLGHNAVAYGVGGVGSLRHIGKRFGRN